MSIKKISSLIVAMCILMSMFAVSVSAQTDQKEMRAVWVSTIYNIDYPSVGSKNNEAKQKQEYIELLDRLQEVGMNTVFVQVRPKADAFYKSNINPWSDILTGTQGQNPGYDPMEFMIEETHKRGMEFHAWLNPYRVTTTGTDVNALAPTHPARLNPNLTMAYNNRLYYNPELEEVKAHITDTVVEIVKNYDVDGIHFDDYFYPSHYPLPAGETKDGQVANMRRQHINEMVERVYHNIKAIDKNVEFGISPIGIWKNQKSDINGSNTDGGEGYYSVFADAKAWINGGYIDYIMPQIYWEIGHAKADYATLVEWWSDVVRGTGVDLYIGQGIYKDEIASTIEDNLKYNANFLEVKGNSYFSLRDILSNRQNVTTSIKKYHESRDVEPIYIKGHVQANNVNVRTGPGSNYSIITKYSTEDVVKVINAGDEWHKIILPNGAMGYISSGYVRLSEDIRLIINNKQVEPTVPPVITNSTTLVPLRIISEKLNSVVDWNQNSKSITIQKDELFIKLYIGSNIAYVNGQEVELLTKPMIENNTTLVPIRFISEQLGASVNWDSVNKIIDIR